jgi:hypothetical protein
MSDVIDDLLTRVIVKEPVEWRYHIGFTGGNKVLSDVHEGKRCLDRHENVVSDMVSPLYWFFYYDSGKQIVYDVRHVAQGIPLIQM